MNYRFCWALLLILFAQYSVAEYIWTDSAHGQWPTAESACRQGEAARRLEAKRAQQPGLNWRVSSLSVQDVDGFESFCRFQIQRQLGSRWLPDGIHLYSVYASGSADLCPSGVLDDAGQCCAECPTAECNGSNPVLGATGQKIQLESDLQWPGSTLGFARNYWSSRNQRSTMGLGWKHNWDRRLVELDAAQVKISREDGRALRFTKAEGAWTPTAGENLQLTQTASGSWVLLTPGVGKQTFSAMGRLVRVEPLAGAAISLSYDDAGLLSSLVDASGRSLALTYSNGLLTRVSGATDVSYQYDAQSRLVGVQRAGQGKTYHYEETTYPQLLTGISDERGLRVATWTYDAQGRATSSSHGDADRVRFDYLDDSRVAITNPLGKRALYQYQTFAQRRLVTRIDGEASASCPASSRALAYQADGLVASRTDWQGNITRYSYDTRGREVSRIEAAGSAVQREVTTQWHPTLSLPERISEPGRVTRYHYDDQGRRLSRSVETR